MCNAPDDRLPPRQRHEVGRLFYAFGAAGQLAFLSIVAIGVTVGEIAGAVASMRAFGAMGFLLAALGLLFQWSAKRELEERGEPVPAAWQRGEGHVLDRLVVAILCYPIGERLTALRDREVSASTGLVLAAVVAQAYASAIILLGK